MSDSEQSIANIASHSVPGNWPEGSVLFLFNPACTRDSRSPPRTSGESCSLSCSPCGQYEAQPFSFAVASPSRVFRALSSMRCPENEPLLLAPRGKDCRLCSCCPPKETQSCRLSVALPIPYEVHGLTALQCQHRNAVHLIPVGNAAVTSRHDDSPAHSAGDTH